MARAADVRECRRDALVVLILGGGTALASLVISSNSQLGPGTVSGHHPPGGKHANVISGSINGLDLANGSITLGKLAPKSVNGSNVAPGSPTGSNLAAGTVAHSNLAAGAVTNSNLAPGAVTHSNPASGAVDGSNVIAGSLTGSDLAANPVAGSNPDAGSVNDALNLRHAYADVAPRQSLAMFTHGTWTLTATCSDDGSSNTHATIALSSSVPAFVAVGDAAGSRTQNVSLVATPSASSDRVVGTDFSAQLATYLNGLEGRVLAATDYEDTGLGPSPFCEFVYDGFGS